MESRKRGTDLTGSSNPTIARFGGALYAVNARFDVVSGPEVDYQVVRLEMAD